MDNIDVAPCAYIPPIKCKDSIVQIKSGKCLASLVDRVVGLNPVYAYIDNTYMNSTPADITYMAFIYDTDPRITD